MPPIRTQSSRNRTEQEARTFEVPRSTLRDRVTHDYRVVAKLEVFQVILAYASLLPTSTICLSTVPLPNRPYTG
ncbi:hypothetical protein PENANT_c048G01254 [Penicillium antarcticum]|uniref:HTH psq-type domain-containing protein n=1 Tax=Penicillium antarcticum TaxID=416450 RepID=A0A1V6PRF1_9EURO|nr:hypothetical protein PENANT_c048G01254 [Penicillium antarcticum]